MDITIRHSRQDDAEAVKSIYSGKQAVAGTLQLPHVADSLWQERLQKPVPGSYSLVAESGGKVVGHIALYVNQNMRRRHSGYIGMAVLDGHNGQGIGTALMREVIDLAESWLNITRLELTVFSDNISARRLYEKSGFDVEGEARGFAFRDGEFVDALYMARVTEKSIDNGNE